MKMTPGGCAQTKDSVQTTPYIYHPTAGKFSSNLLTLLLLLLVIAIGFSCGGPKSAVKDFDDDSDEDPALAAKLKRNVIPQPDTEVAVIETADFGSIVIELYPNLAPQMVERFKKLINEGFYNGTTFHRVNPELGIIQGGDPLSRDSDPANDGTGDSPYPNVPGEMSDLPYERGIVGAARKGAIPAFEGQTGLTEAQARDTANCQFYITLKRQPSFDDKYTVFGKVIQGISAADAISGAPVDEGTEHPAEKIIIKSITLQPRSKFSGQ
jgi:peptidyl-prolyl cis-trans isomerase B (cyclophilin B)